MLRGRHLASIAAKIASDTTPGATIPWDKFCSVARQCQAWSSISAVRSPHSRMQSATSNTGYGDVPLAKLSMGPLSTASTAQSKNAADSVNSAEREGATSETDEVQGSQLDARATKDNARDDGLIGSERPSAGLSNGAEEPALSISIDRSGLYNPELHSHDFNPKKEPETPLAKQLKALIRFRGGPITVAEYMSEALTNPTAGYYMQNDVFGKSGDFVTSPEISQLFGEMVGIWCVLQWQKMGSPKSFRLVELGPGRGTLMADLLRGMAFMKPFSAALRVHFVEVSEALRKIQRTTLGCNPPREWSQKNKEHKDRTTSAVSKFSNVPVRWHRSLDEIPEDIPAIYIAHEFFDALPAHQFVKTERGWCERLVDIAGSESNEHFRFVLSPGATPASSLLLKKRFEAIKEPESESVKQIEISALAISAAENLAKRVARHGGAALIVDYGKDSHFDASVQAIRDHKFVNLLSRPGEADLSCRVDFAALRQGVEQSGADAEVHGPLPQAFFLAGLGIEARLDSLLKNSTEEQQEVLIRGYNRIVGGQDSEAPPDKPPESSPDLIVKPAEDVSKLGASNPERKGANDHEEMRSIKSTLSKLADASVTQKSESNLTVQELTSAESEAEQALESSKQKLAADLEALGDKMKQSHEEEGMGYSYKVLAITKKGSPAPEPFHGSGVEFE